MLMRADDHEAAAVDIIAMLGDSVVGVTHRSNRTAIRRRCRPGASPDRRAFARGGNRARIVTAVAASVGVACVVAAGIAFALAVGVADDNAAARARWLGAHKPAYAWRPHALDGALDAIVIGGLALAAAAFVIACARRRRGGGSASAAYRIGTARGVDQPVIGAPAASFALVAPCGDGFVVELGDGMVGEAVTAEGVRPLAAPCTIPITVATRIRARVGGATFLISAIAAPRRQAVPLVAVDQRAAAYLGASLALHLASYAFLSQVPILEAGQPRFGVELYDPQPIDVVVRDGDVAFAPPDPAEDVALMTSDEARPSMSLPLPASSADGAIGDAHVATMTRAQAIEAARMSGPLDSALLGTSIVDLVGTGDLDAGFVEPGFGMGVFDGAASADGFGEHPMRRAPGAGGGGPGAGVVQTGAYLSGWGCGCGEGSMYGSHISHAGTTRFGRTGAVPSVVIDAANVIGSLDKTLIRRYVRRATAKIEYCYDRRLLVDPHLAGDVTVQFFIAPAGTVATADATGFDAEVASCVAGVVKAIEFPRPRDGDGVQVSYPFTFRAAVD